MWFFLRFHLICLQNYRLDFFYQGLSQQSHMFSRLFDKHIPSYFPWICVLMCLNWQKCDLLWFFFIVKLFFYKSTHWISIIKISQDSSEISEGDSEKYIRLCTLLRSPEYSKIPRIAERNDGIDIGVELSRTRFKAFYSRFLYFLPKLIKNFVIGWKICGARRGLVLLSFTLNWKWCAIEITLK